MARRFSIFRPALTVSKRGKIGLRGPFMRMGGLNLSRSGVSYSQKVGPGTINTRTGLRMPIGGSKTKLSKPQGCAITVIAALALSLCCLILVLIIPDQEAVPTPTLTATQLPTPTRTVEWHTPEPQATFTPIPTPTNAAARFNSPSEPICSCEDDVYNCPDFQNMGITGQACFDYCRSLGVGDIHGLDADEDGLVCEQKP